MEQTSSQEARNLRALATQLRQSAFDTDDEAYIELFLRAARELDERVMRAPAGPHFSRID